MPSGPFQILYQSGGLYLPQLGLWMDPHEPKTSDLVFVSHAHSDHTAPHREVVLSQPTAQLMRARLGGEWIEHVLPFGRPLAMPGKELPYEITLLPAGHIFGSAMAWVRAESSTLLYTGDFKLRPGLSAEPCEPRPADVLVMETTYGRPQYVFPPTTDVMQGIIRFCREALDNEETPVLLGYSLGKCQELLRGLSEAGLPLMLHGAVHKMTEVYERLGQSFPPYAKFDAAQAAGKVVLCPPGTSLRNFGRARVAVLTGWAVDPNCRFRYQAHAAFPLSDHADFPELIEFVKRVAPKKVYTLHGFASAFAQTLRDHGYDAQALSEEDQLTLPLAIPSSPNPRTRRIPATRPTALVPERVIADADAFAGFAAICAKIAGTTRKLEKTRWLAEYLKELSPEPLRHAAVWFTGAPFPSSQNKPLQLGWAVIRDALCAAGDIEEARFGQIYLKHSDLGEAAFEIMERAAGSRPTRANRLSLVEVQTTFEQLHTARGPSAKLPLMIQVLRRASPLEAKFLVKILTGDLRIGLKEGLVEEAIASAFEAPLDSVKQANLLVGDTGETAALARQRQLPAVTLIPFRPVKYMLASPEESAGAIWKRVMGWHLPGPTPSESALPNLPLPALETPIWVEDKYDGIRAQLHKVGQAVAFYSRDLKEITDTFDDLAGAARAMPEDFIVDGEIVAMRGDQVLPFAELQRRLGRRESDLFLRDEIPVQFVAFDLLWGHGQHMIHEPLERRRAALESLKQRTFKLAQITQARSEEEIEAAFAAARERRNEGLIIKDPRGAYLPGRRGLSWLKLKKAWATLDCVVVGAEYGHGKRRAVLSDYTFAVRDTATGELKTIGKAYTGLTDVEIAQLTQHFLKRVLWKKGRFHAVEPDTVLEIAFDLLQASARHNSGLAMRFPRILRIRTDKTPTDIDTLDRAWTIARSATRSE